MNDRIKQLAEQSGMRTVTYEDGEETYFTESLDAQKFAELIIEECRNALADEYRKSPIETIGCFIRADEVIAKHFYGVKDE